jgi:hypothetical protein
LLAKNETREVAMIQEAWMKLVVPDFVRDCEPLRTRPKVIRHTHKAIDPIKLADNASSCWIEQLG